MKSDAYKQGHKDGRAGFAQHSGQRDYVHGYRYGRQEYEYWHGASDDDDVASDESDATSANGKNAIFIDGKNTATSSATSIKSLESSSDSLGLGSLLGVVFFWLCFLLFPAALFAGGDSPVFNIILWGGLTFIGLLLIMIIATAKPPKK